MLRRFVLLSPLLGSTAIAAAGIVRPMRRLVPIVLLVLTSAFAVPAIAETRQMASHPSGSDLQKACGTAGGSFVDNRDIDPAAGYSCIKENCDGNGGVCRVDCGSKGCAGTTPTRLVAPTTLIGILQNGNRVVLGLKGGGTESLSGDGGGGAVPPEPVADPPAGDEPIFLY